MAIKRNLIRFGLFCLYSILLTGCISDVDIDKQLDEEEKMVLYCRLCPQIETTSVYLTHTTMLFSTYTDELSAPVAEAIVELSSDKVHWTRAHYDNIQQRYLLPQSEFRIESGVTYYIRASHPDFEEISAECTVPHIRDIDLQFVNEQAINDTHYGETFDFSHIDHYLQWKDYPGEGNRYMFIIGNPDPESSSLWHSLWIVYLTDNKEYTYIFSDEGRDGQTIKCYYGTEYENKGDEENEQFGVVFLDKNCYNYEKSRIESDNSMEFFMLEPLHFYNNIENGYGLFGACAITTE